MRALKILPLFVLVFLLQACAAIKPLDYEEPTVTVTSVKALPTQGEAIIPTFEIKLHIINPNTTALKLKGVSYNVLLEGHKVLTGVSNQIPEIAAYGEGDVTLRAAANMFNSIRLLADLMQNNRQSLDYELKAKLDFGSLSPNLYVTDKGTVKLQ